MNGVGTDNLQMPRHMRPRVVTFLALCAPSVAWCAAASPESLMGFQHVGYPRVSGAAGDISALAQDTDGFLWMKVARGSVRFDGKTFMPFDGVPALLRPPVDAVDADGNAWSVAEGRLWRVPRGSTVKEPVPAMPPHVRQVVVGRTGRVYLRGDDGIHFFRRDGASLQPIAAPIEDRQANGLTESRTGALWITSTTGVLLASAEALDTAERTGRMPATETFGRSQGLTGAFPYPIIEDTTGNVWVGTESGLDVFRRRPFTVVALPEGMHGIQAGTDRYGTTWVGSDNLSTFRIDSSGSRSATPMMAPTHAMVLDPRRGVVWAANAQGLWRLADTDASLVAPPPFRDPATAVGFLAVEGGGRILAAPRPVPGHAAAPTMAWDGRVWQTLGALPGVPTAAATDRRGVTWFALSTPATLARLDKDKVSVVRRDRDTSVSPIRAMAPDRGGVWLGGDDGVRFFDGARFHAVLSEPRDLLRWVTGLVVDDAGYLWVETSALVFRSRATVDAVASASPSTPIAFDRFDDTDGIPGGADPTRGLPSLRTSPDGRLWVTTVAGLSWIDPSRYPQPRTPATPRIDRIDVGGVRRPVTAGVLALGARERDVAIHYSVAELSRPDQVHVQYRLRPGDATWTDAGASRDIILTGLPPGRAIFEVRALLGTRASGAAALLPIDRATAFEETTAFRALLIASAIGLAGLLVALRMRAVSRRLRIRAEEREAIARDIHDTLLQRFQGAMLTMESLANRPAIPTDERHDIARVAAEAKRAIVEGRERIQGLRGSADASVALYDHILAEGQRMSARGGPAFAVTLSGVAAPLREEAAGEIGAIAVEAMINAFTHAQATRVEVSIAYGADGVWLVVSDDGRGFDPEATERAVSGVRFGLRGMRERAATQRGTVRIESAPGEGTEIHVFVPRRAAYR